MGAVYSGFLLIVMLYIGFKHVNLASLLCTVIVRCYFHTGFLGNTVQAQDSVTITLHI